MAWNSDPRHWQIAILGGLLAYGALWLGFDVSLGRALPVLAVALATEALCARLSGKRFDPRSPLISGLSLALLLRSDGLGLALLAAGIAIGSKYALRVRGKHVFNPTCFAIVVLLVASERVWVSTGQWGSAALGAFAFAGLGSLVIHRTRRSDVTWAFLAAYAAIVCGRSLWLGEPLAIALHQLESGALLLFAFFMISDPRTLPDARAGRLLFACAVAATGAWIQLGLYRAEGLLFALAALSPLVPLCDRLLPGLRYVWPGPTPNLSPKENPMRPLVTATLWLLALWLPAASAQAFCGFYVAKADAKLFNEASQVVLARDGDRTVITMSNDFQGAPEEFAMVIPVPTFIEREQIHVGDRKTLEHLDAYTAPRLVEYFDPDPCARLEMKRAFEADAMGRLPQSAPARGRASALGVRIEAEYSVGEYEILILSAEQSDGLVAWLRESGYRLPEGAEPVVSSYLRQGMRFFVAKVNVEAQQRLGFAYLRPLQIAFESPKFMLPIRLGTLNARGPQELFVYTLTRKGRVESTNYRTVKLPTGQELPTFVKNEFGDFYKALFDEQVRRENMRSVFLEYAWDMNWCDPCAADPLSPEQLRSLGAYWVQGGAGRFAPPGRGGKGLARDVFVTRLHVRYDARTFPADLRFQETADRTNFQGRYVLRHPFAGAATCPAAEAYRRQVADRQASEARTLASLTGWSLADIHAKLGPGFVRPAAIRSWWQEIWPD